MKIQGLSNTISQSINNLDNNSKSKVNFGEFLDQQLNKVNSLQKQDEDYKKMLAIGEVDNIHNAMIATEKADLALQLTLSIENKLMDAYKEIMRMQI